MQSTIDILKMDIEGSEWDSLAAIVQQPDCLKNVKQLMIEYHTEEINPKKQSSRNDLLVYWNIARALDRLGFKLWTFWNNDFCHFFSKRTPGRKYIGCFNAYYLNVNLIVTQ